MKFIKYLLFLVLIGFIGVSVYIAVQPNSFKITKKYTINAPASVVFNYVNNLKNWKHFDSWSAFENVNTLNSINGEGQLNTIQSNPENSILQELTFDDLPNSNITWSFSTTKNKTTEISWTLSTESIPFKNKAYNLIYGGKEHIIAKHYAESLKKLDSAVIASMKVYKIKVNGSINYGGGYYLYTTNSCRIDELDEKLKSSMRKVTAFAEKNNIVIAGLPFIHYLKRDSINNATTFECCIPTTEQIISTESNILTGQIIPFEAIKTTLQGDYSNINEAWNTTLNYISKQNLVFPEHGTVIQTFLNDSNAVPNPANWLSEIYFQVQPKDTEVVIEN